jgi:Flp pilus assembly protein TadG
MRKTRKSFVSSSSTSGQSLIETVLLVPFLLFLVFNAINFGYFFYVALNLAAAPRTSALYGAMGQATPRSDALPPPGDTTNPESVAFMGYQDMAGAFGNWSTAPIEICSVPLGVTNANTTTEQVNCVAYNSGSFTWNAIPSDPEAPDFKLQRVDIRYTFHPLIPGWVFSLAMLPAPICQRSGGSLTCTFRRRAIFRAMN